MCLIAVWIAFYQALHVFAQETEIIINGVPFSGHLYTSLIKKNLQRYKGDDATNSILDLIVNLKILLGQEVIKVTILN